MVLRLVLDGEELKIVVLFGYLVCYLTRDSNMLLEISSLISKALVLCAGLRQL